MNNADQTPKYLYKILTEQQWEAMREMGLHYTKSSTLDQRDGYIHLSTAHQVERIAKKYFQDIASVKILKLDYHKLSGLIKWEPNSTGDLFPHCYHEISVDIISHIEGINVYEYDFSRLEY